MELTLGGREIKTTAAPPSRLSMLLWGSAGCGKTTLAATAPGKKLWISFDPDGTASLTGRSDVLVDDLAQERNIIVEKFKSEDPMGYSKFITENDIDTVVIDSLTNFAHMATMHAVTVTKGATIERPSMQGYGTRNALTLQLVKNMLRMTGKLKKNCIFISHEDSPVTNDDGVVLFISIMIGGKLAEQAPLDLSECWYMSDKSDGKKYIAIRPVRQRKPMKTRMFATDKGSEFEWRYNPETDEGMKLADWVAQWQAAGKKIPLPK